MMSETAAHCIESWPLTAGPREMTLTVSGSDSATARRTVPELSSTMNIFMTHYRDKFIYLVGVISRRADSPKVGRANPIAVLSIKNLDLDDKL
jgi:hypothetical protein